MPSILLTVIMIITMIIFSPPSLLTSATLNGLEKEVLIYLWNATGGNNWTNKTNWLTGDPCLNEWYGVQCDNSNSHIIILDFFNNGLMGTIPESIGNLSYLQSLDLSSNNLTTTIPSSIGNLSSLLELIMYEDNLIGTIPSTIGSLTRLTMLELSTNRLNGTIPSSFGGLTSLLELWIEETQLSGTIPNIIGQLSTLNQIWLDKNQLSGPIPDTFTQLSNLNRLVLFENQISGDLSVLPSLISLTNVDLFNNSISGTIPQNIDLLTNLQKLWVNSNYLTGTIPSSLGQLTILRYLSLSDNNLTGIIPPQLGQLISLQVLNLTDNKLNGTLPSQLANLIHLSELYLYNNHLSGGCFPLNYIVPYCNIGNWKFHCLCEHQPTCNSGTCSLQLDFNPITRSLTLVDTFLNVTDPLSTFKSESLVLSGTSLHFTSSLVFTNSTLYLLDTPSGTTRQPSTVSVRHLAIYDSEVYVLDPSMDVIEVRDGLCVSLVNVTFYFPWQDESWPFLMASCYTNYTDVRGELYNISSSVKNITSDVCYDVVLTKQPDNNWLAVQMVEKDCSPSAWWTEEAKVGLAVALAVVVLLIVLATAYFLWFYKRDSYKSTKKF